MPRGLRVTASAVAVMNVLALTASITVAVVGVPERFREPRLILRPPVSAAPVLRPQSAGGGATPGSEGGSGSAEAMTGASLSGQFADAIQSPALGPSVAAMVVEPASGRTLLRRQAVTPTTPASTTKLLTAGAALAALGPATTLPTEVVRGRRPGSIVLVGGGDPTLASPEADRHSYPRPARLEELAKRTVAALRESGTTTARLRYDDSLFTGPVTASTWDGYVAGGYVAPVTALMVDGGRVQPDTGQEDHGGDERAANPSRAAAELFAELLRKQGITVRDQIAERTAPPTAQRLAVVRSAPVSALVEQMLSTSDNTLAEVLGRHVARAVGRPASFRGATAAVEQVLDRLGVPTGGIKLHDCSGLSYENTVTARALTRLLSLAAGKEHPDLRSVLTGLPVAGYSGTLRDRYGGGPAAAAAGFVRAKTGTLNRVSTLAGVAYRPDGRMLVFAVLADHIPLGGVSNARAALDRVAAALARCPCN